MYSRQSPIDFAVDVVDRVILLKNRARLARVLVDQRVECIAKHGAGELRHFWKLGARRAQTVGGLHLHRALCNVDGLVTDTLEVGRCLDGGNGEAKVTADRLPQRQNAHREVVHLHLVFVHEVVGLHDFVGQAHVAVLERAHRNADHLFASTAHCEEAILEIAQLRLELLVRVREQGSARARHYPNLPEIYSSVRFLEGRVNMFSVFPCSMSSPM